MKLYLEYAAIVLLIKLAYWGLSFVPSLALAEPNTMLVAFVMIYCINEGRCE